MRRREKWVHIRVDDEEREAWQAQADDIGLTLSDLIRLRMGDARPVHRDPAGRRGRRSPPRADPALLTALGRIGSNLNQVARWANTYKDRAEAVQVLAALVGIEQQILQVLSSHRPAGVSGAKPLTDEEG